MTYFELEMTLLKPLWLLLMQIFEQTLSEKIKLVYFISQFGCYEALVVLTLFLLVLMIENFLLYYLK